MMWFRQSKSVALALFVTALAASLGTAAAAGNVAPNLTGLPAYPNLKSGTMMGDPHACWFYNAQSMDSLNAVVSWYRAHLPGQTPVMTENEYDGMQADFGMHAGTQVLVFSSPHFKNAGTSIVLNKSCPKAHS